MRSLRVVSGKNQSARILDLFGTVVRDHDSCHRFQGELLTFNIKKVRAI